MLKISKDLHNPVSEFAVLTYHWIPLMKGFVNAKGKMGVQIFFVIKLLCVNELSHENCTVFTSRKISQREELLLITVLFSVPSLPQDQI